MPDPCFPGSVSPYQLSYFTSCVSALLVVVITTGNVLIILAVAKDPLRKLRNPFAFFLANAALSDLMVGIIAMPVSAGFHYMEAKQQINQSLIYVLHLTYFVSASASLFSMAAMAIDRYYALMSLSTNHRIFTFRKCLIISLLIWVLAVAFSGFYFLVGYVTLVVIYINISLVTTFGITLLTYLKVIRRMRRFNSTLAYIEHADGRSPMKRKPSKKDRTLMRERKVTTVFMSLLVTFMCLYIPTTIFVYILQFCLSFNCNTRHILRDSVFLLVSACSALNPIVCLVKLPLIRQAVCAVVKCRKRQVRSDSSSRGDEPPVMIPDSQRRDEVALQERI